MHGFVLLCKGHKTTPPPVGRIRSCMLFNCTLCSREIYDYVTVRVLVWLGCHLCLRCCCTCAETAVLMWIMCCHLALPAADGACARAEAALLTHLC